MSGRAQGVPVEVHSPEDLRHIALFRTEAWMADGFVQPGELVEGVYPIPDDALCRHWVIEENGRIVAAGRLSVHESVEEMCGAAVWERFTAEIPFPCACITRLVVHRDARKHGYAHTLDESRVAAMRGTKCRGVIGVPLPGREHALAKLGFQQIAWEPSFYHAPYGAVPNGLPVMLLLL